MTFQNLSFHATRIARFWRAHGIQALWDRTRAEISGRNGSPFLRSVFSQDPAQPYTREDKNAFCIRTLTGIIPPLQTYPSPFPTRRVTLLLDNVLPPALYDRTGTCILAALWIAREMHCSLRIVTQQHKARKSVVRDLLLGNHMEWERDIEFFEISAAPTQRKLSISPEDIFLVASQSALDGILPTIPASRIFYLALEDERCHFPSSQVRLRCDSILRDPRLRFLVGTQQLFDQFMKEGFINIQENGICFEPAFPPALFSTEPHDPARKKIFLFFAQPSNPQHLAHLGLGAVERAILTGVLDPKKWEFYFAGGDFSSFHWIHSVTTHILPEIAGPEYAALLRKTDLGLALHDGPEPSYVPLQLAASGAIAVTNRMPGILGKAPYSENIFYAEPDADSIVRAIAAGTNMAVDSPLRQEHFARQQLPRDWTASFHMLTTRLHTDWKNVFDTPAAD